MSITKKLFGVFAVLAVAFAVALPGAAFAQKKKKKPATADKLDLSTGPASADQLMGGGSMEPPEVTRRRDEAIQQLTDLIRSMSDGRQKAVRMVQLAELYWEKSQVLHLRAVQRFNSAYDKWFAATEGGRKRGPREPKLKNFDTEAPQFTKKAVQIYEYVLKKYPKNNPRAHQAMFYLGLNYLDLKQQKRAEEVFRKLTRNYPQSEFIPDAHLAVGEFHFENKNIDEALKAYKAAAKYTNAKNYGYAKYKLGWCYLNSGNPADAKLAVQSFKTVISWSDTHPDAGLNLKDQALKDLVAAYAELGTINIDEAAAYFNSVGGGKFFRAMLQLLAGTYFEQGRDDESIAVYRRLIKLDPMSVDVLSWETEVMKAFIRKGNRELVLKQMATIVALLKDGSRWVKANAGEGDKIASYRESTELAISKYTFEVYTESLRLHKRYSGKESWSGFLRAEQYCDYYLQTFPKSRNTYEMTMMLAETRWKIANHKFALEKGPAFRIDKYNLAGQTYKRVMESGKKNKGKHFKNAGDGFLLAYDKIIEVSKPKKPAKNDFKPMPLPKSQQQLIAASDYYVQAVPKGKRVLPAKYKAAYTYYEYNQTDKAVPRFANIIKQHPDSPQARFAADLILDTLSVKKDTANVNKYARQFLTIPGLVKDAAFKANLDSIVEKSSFNMIAPLEQQKKHEAAAKAYLAFEREFPKSDFLDKAVYNASVNYMNAEMVGEAIKLRERFIQSFPKSDYTPNVVLFLGDNYRKITNFERAVYFYELLATKYPNSFKDKNGKTDKQPATDALYNAALFRENLGQSDKAISNYRSYLKRVGKNHKDSHEILFTIGMIYEKRGNQKQAQGIWTEFISTYGKKFPDKYLDCLVKRADYEYAKGNKNGSRGAYAQYKAITVEYARFKKAKKKIGPTGLTAAAKSAFIILEPEFKDYLAMRVDLPKGVRKPYTPKRIKKIDTHMGKKIKDKLLAVKAMSDKYKAVVANYKQGEWAVASLYQIGQIQEDFAKELTEAPIPPYLTPDQIDIYKFDLQQQYAEPALKGAIDIYKKGLSTSHDYTIYSDYTRKSMGALKRLQPDQFRDDPERRIEAGDAALAVFSSPLLDLK